MKNPKQTSLSRVAFLGSLMLLLLYPIGIETASAQTAPRYFVTVNPRLPDSPIYTHVGENWTISFEAFWSHGAKSGQAIGNAAVTVQVNNRLNKTVDMLLVNTTSAGVLSFNYSSSTADVLAFTPTHLTTQDGEAYTQDLTGLENDVFGLQARPVVVWWDTFHVSLVSYETGTLGLTSVWVNATYLLLPEEGLPLPEWATYSHQTFLPKIVHGANVTINGVRAVEESEGIYRANVSSWLPTAYVLVAVSQEGWITTNTAFSFAQTSNEPIWAAAASVGVVVSIVALAVPIVSLRKSKDSLSVRKAFAIVGGILLALSSVLSFYWGLLGIEGVLHRFDWAMLAVLGPTSFAFGLTAAVMSVRMKKQAVVIFALLPPLLVNTVLLKTSMDPYALPNPTLMIVGAFALSIVSGILICNADEGFT